MKNLKIKELKFGPKRKSDISLIKGELPVDTKSPKKIKINKKVLSLAALKREQNQFFRLDLGKGSPIYVKRMRLPNGLMGILSRFSLLVVLTSLDVTDPTANKAVKSLLI